MDIVVNNLELLLALLRKGLLLEECDVRYLVIKSNWDDEDMLTQALLKSKVSNGTLKLLSPKQVSYTEVNLIYEQHGFLRYVWNDFVSIALCRKKGYRLLTDNSAIIKLAQTENVKVVSPQTVEEIVIRKMKLEDKIQNKKVE